MNKKILLSVVASALLSTSAFAATDRGTGNLNIAAPGVSAAGLANTEYNEKYGYTNSFAFTDMNYTAQIKGSGAVSDALVRVNVTDTNLSSTTVPAVDLDTLFGNQIIINTETNLTVAVYDRSIVDDANNTWVLFAGNSDQSIVNGKEYRMRDDDDNSTSAVTYKFTSGNELQLDVWSTSGSEEIRDLTKRGTSSELINQFSTSCITKFDGLINIESFQDSFVTTAHDNAVAETTDGLSQLDTLVFTVNNNRKGTFLEGNATAITMQTRNADGSVNVDNNFALAAWGSSIVAVQENGTSNTYALAHDTTNVTTHLALNAANPALTAVQGNIHYTTDGNLTFILPNTPMPNGTTTYYVNLQHTAGAAGIKPVNFVNARIALEAGLADNNNTLYPAADAPRGAAQDAGKWVDHAYISQIPAGESGGAAKMSTRYFITNRSCSVVTPQIDVVYNGNVYSATNVAELAIDTQGVYTLKDIMLSIPELATVWNANTSTKVSVEITLPGIAENFYIYAQVKNKSIDQFKDLPVYNTSGRD